MTWPRQRVFVLAGVIFAAHVIAIFALHTPAPMVLLPDGFRSPRSPQRMASTNGFVELDGLDDPLVFAGAHQHGFSASAWMMHPAQEYELTNSLPEPRYLAFSRTPLELPRIDHGLDLQSAAALPFVEFALPKERARSTFAIEGPLAARKLLSPVEPPVQIASDVLSNTVVQLGVRADGFPFSARIVSSSGSRVADLAALNLANQARFAPLPLPDPDNPARLQWGEFVFQWFTTEPTATNTAAKASIPGAK
jgi:hypothetical protein